jgi:iron complex outermembrane receptor protein
LGLVAKSTVSLEKIDSKKVFLNGGTQFSDVIDRVPGVTITNGQANIRGGSGFTFGVGSRVLMLVDGLPMLGAYEGDIRWHFLPMEQVQSVEVLKEVFS